METLCYFYHPDHPDHLGSTSWVTDSAKNGVQYCEYLPYGEPFIDQRSTTWSSRYTFSGKERDSETGYSYFGARFYHPDPSIWLSVDPMSDKYPNLTPYAYCANNPVILVDPDGRDVWEINDEGRIINRIKDKTQDAFYMVAKDADGNYQRTYTTDADGNKNYNSISFEYGTVESQRSISFSPDGKTTDTYDVYKVRGDNNGTALFEFMSNSSSVEWSQAKMGLEGNKGLNFLTTSHEKSTERGMSYLINGQLRFGYTAREFNHNHPSNTAYPSGSFDNPRPPYQKAGEWGDVGFAKGVSNIFGTNVKFNIFTPNNKGYIPFNSQSRLQDYGR